MQRTHKHGRMHHPHVICSEAMDVVLSMLDGADESSLTHADECVDKMTNQCLVQSSKCGVYVLY